MNFVKRVTGSMPPAFIFLNILHLLNDGFESSYLLLLPFVSKDLHINLTQIGTLGTLLFAFSFILALPSGYIAMKLGGFMTLILSLFIYGVGFIGVGLSTSYLHLLLVFTLGGIGFALFHPIAFALIAKWSTKETRGSAMGSFSAIGDLGNIGISTLLAFIVIYIGWQGTAFLYGIIAILIALYFYVYIVRNNNGFARQKHIASNVSLWHILSNKQFIYASATNMFDNFASQTLFVFLPFLLLKRGVNPAILGLFTGAFFVGSFIGRLFLGKLVDRYGNTKIFMGAEILMAIIIFILANSTPLYVIITCAIFLGIVTKGTNPIVKTMVSESVEHHGNFEKAYGLNSITSNLAQAIAPIVLGYISDKSSIVMAFNVMAVVALLAIIPAFGFHKGKK